MLYISQAQDCLFQLKLKSTLFMRIDQITSLSFTDYWNSKTSPYCLRIWWVLAGTRNFNWSFYIIIIESLTRFWYNGTPRRFIFDTVSILIFSCGLTIVLSWSGIAFSRIIKHWCIWSVRSKRIRRRLFFNKIDFSLILPRTRYTFISRWVFFDIDLNFNS